ncbi:MAG: GNAT family N-acetyltransferase [Chloroflexi bacterium RBG_13_50_10]|jgi:putative acetyltransferase|nr:MAG: GNAT family N-acetyltransferase [Chloroflexi bacterium RBG_13_50_10]
MLIIRPETSKDIVAIHHINEEAFGQKQEAEIVEKLRSRGTLTISLVAVQNNEIVGHIAFSRVKVEAEHSSFEAIALAPMSVLPANQRKGIGSQLVRAGLKECRHLGYEIVVVLGHPNYYPRFGFSPAKPKGIDCEFQVPDEAWMILELKDGALAGRRGTVRFQPEFSEAT